MIEHLFDPDTATRPPSTPDELPFVAAQPWTVIARLRAVITTGTLPRPARRTALDLVWRVAAIALVTVLILGLLPALTEAAA